MLLIDYILGFCVPLVTFLVGVSVGVAWRDEIIGIIGRKQ